MYRSILVPLDGSSASERVLPIACDLARRSGALLHLAHAHVAYTAAPIYIEGMPVIDEQMRSLGKTHERAYLEGIRDRLVAQSDLRVTIAVLDPADADARDQTVPRLLASYAATTGADLIVMATHGRGGLARLWLGSVADALVRTSSVPILLIRPDEDTEPVQHPAMFRHILIPLDGSALAEQVLEPAQVLGDLTQAAYTLLHVVEPHMLIRSGPFTAPTDLSAEDTQQRQIEAQGYLERIAQLMRAAGATVSVDVRVAEHVAATILEAAGEQRFDLIAIATHGRSGIARLMLGSVADKVVRGAGVPVLLYRPRGPHPSSE